MKILLIQPNSTTEAAKDYISLQFPLNLGYIAAVLRKANHEVRLIDFNVMDQTKLKDSISEFNPELVGLTAMTSSIMNAKDIISKIKKMDKEIITILGGVHASALPLETMNETPDLDYLVFGEGELTVADLVNHIINKKDLSNVKGIVYRNGKNVIKNQPRELIEDMDSIPFPARDLIPLNLYATRHVSRGFSRKEKNIIEIMTSRGCPNNCIFCATHINYGLRVRFRTAKNVIREISECIEKYGVNHVSVEDDTFTLNKNTVKELCDFFRKKKITWNCNGRVNTVNYSLLKMMSKSGCKKIAFGVETGNPDMLLKIKKGITIPQVIQAVKDAKKAGIRYVECDFIIGAHPDETLSQVQDSIKLIYKLMPDFLAVSIMCPYPGTELYNIMKERNYLRKNPDWTQFTLFGDLNRYKKLTYLTTKQMVDLQNNILKKYYSSPRYILSQISQIGSLNELKYFLRMGTYFMKEFFSKH